MIAALFLCLAPVAVDGDTLHCRGAAAVRLIGIDAPELPGHCRRGRVCTPGDGFRAKRSLAALIERRAVTCRSAGHDRYGRILARCEAGGIDLSCAMIASGQAVARYSRISCPSRKP